MALTLWISHEYRYFMLEFIKLKCPHPSLVIIWMYLLTIYSYVTFYAWPRRFLARLSQNIYCICNHINKASLYTIHRKNRTLNKESPTQQTENVAGSVWLRLFIDRSGNCKLPFTFYRPKHFHETVIFCFFHMKGTWYVYLFYKQNRPTVIYFSTINSIKEPQ